MEKGYRPQAVGKSNEELKMKNEELTKQKEFMTPSIIPLCILNS